MTLQTYEIINEITTVMKQLSNIYANEVELCSNDLDKVYFLGKERGMLDGVVEIQKIMTKYEAREKKE